MDSLLASFSLTAIDCLLAAIFAAIAFTYAAVGLGGGSAYTALLVIANLPAASIPTIALTMNLIVTSAGGYQFVRGGHARPGLITPFLISSIPAAYLGGALQLSETLFQVLLLISLAALLPLLLLPKTQTRRPPSGTGTFVLTALVGGGFLGFLAGAAGIGGGIYLAPLIVVRGRTDRPRPASRSPLGATHPVRLDRAGERHRRFATGRAPPVRIDPGKDTQPGHRRGDRFAGASPLDGVARSSRDPAVDVRDSVGELGDFFAADGGDS